MSVTQMVLRGRLPALLLTGLFASAWSLPCGAEATQAQLREARQLFAEAEGDRAAQRWQVALGKLERVVVIKETAGVRFHMGVCLEELGRWVEAARSFERSRELAAENGVRDVLAVVDERIESLRARIPTVTVRVPPGVDSVAVWVDGELLEGGVGDPVALDPGQHRVAVQAQGGQRAERDMMLQASQREVLEVPVSVSEVPNRQAEPAEPRPAAPTQEQQPLVPTAAWIAFGAGAALGAGGYLAYARAGEVADESVVVCAASARCDPERASTVRRMDAIALASWTGAAVAVGMGVALTLWHHSDGSFSTALVVTPSASTLHGTF